MSSYDRSTDVKANVGMSFRSIIQPQLQTNDQHWKSIWSPEWVTEGASNPYTVTGVITCTN